LSRVSLQTRPFQLFTEFEDKVLEKVQVIASFAQQNIHFITTWWRINIQSQWQASGNVRHNSGIFCNKSKVVSERSAISQLVTKLYVFLGIPRFTTLFTTANHWYLFAEAELISILIRDQFQYYSPIYFYVSQVFSSRFFFSTKSSMCFSSHIRVIDAPSISLLVTEVPKLWVAPSGGVAVDPLEGMRVVCMRDILILNELWAKDLHFFWLEYFTYHSVPVLAQNYKQHILSPAEVTFFGVVTRRLMKMKYHCCPVHILFVLLCRRKELLHFGLNVHLQDQYSIPFPFLHCDKCKTEILRADSNRRLIQV
jgi:hypothetical protein